MKMYRILLICGAILFLIAGCGTAITITIPGGVAGAVGGGGGAAAQDFLREASPPKGYERFLSSGAHNFRHTFPGEPVRRGRLAERYELRENDCALADCPNGRLRAEIRESEGTVTAKVGRDAWYGWSFYNENIGAVTRDQSLGLVFGQWKGGGDVPPVVRIVQVAAGTLNWQNCDPAICNKAGTDAEDVVVELEDMHQAANWGAAQNYGDVCRLFSMAEMRGKWVDIVMNTNFGANPEGYLRIWVNGVLRCAYFGQMVSPATSRANGGILNHRRGIFASYTKPWRVKQGATPIPTLIAYYDEYVTGNDRGDVDTGFRESSGLRPRD